MNYYIQGDAANADKIKAAFENKGFKFLTGSPSADKCNYHYTFMTKKGFHHHHNDNLVYCLPRGEWEAQVILNHPDYKELELPVEPKFKVGDSLQSGSDFTKILSINLEEGRYYCDNRIISFENQDLWHLVPKPHYDIANFNPFDKVLVRDSNGLKWTADLFSYIDDGFVCTGGIPCRQCIPFEGNEHLLGTTDPCDEQYINWQND